MTKPVPDLVIDKLGTHLFRVTRKDGSQSFKWDWDLLLKEVQQVTNDKLKQDIVDLMSDVSVKVNQMQDITKQNIVTVTEAKVKRTRKKKQPV